jgi:7-cyano-7-deazaguanine synthase
MQEDYTEINSTLVALSGGQDSTTCLFMALRACSRVEAFSCDYGQRHSAELTSSAFIYHLAYNFYAGRLTSRYRKVIKLPPFEGSSPLSNPAKPLEEYESFSQMATIIGDRQEKTYVPNRNMTILSVAANMAVAREIQSITIGVSADDIQNYDDCRQDFIEKAEAAIQSGTGTKLKIVAPLINKTKKDIVKLARFLPGCWDALAFTVTDYAGAYPPKNNHASVLRAEGFRQAGCDDPLIERARGEGLLLGVLS